MGMFKNSPIGRRRMLVGTFALASGATLAGPSQGSPAKSLRVAWWGSVDRAKKFNAIFAAWKKKNPNVASTGEYADFDPYWDRFATQSAGGNLPDVVGMTEREITVYNDS